MDLAVAQVSGEIGTFLSALTTWASVVVPHFVGALVLLVVGWWIAGRAQRATAGLLNRQSRIDAMLSGVIASIVRYSILVVVVVAVDDTLGLTTFTTQERIT